MRRLTPTLLALLAPTLAALALAAGPATSWAASTQPPALSAAQQHYLALAQQGVAQAKQRWGNQRLGWYDSRLSDRDRYPLATIWDIVPLFESLDAIAIAQPTPANRAARDALCRRAPSATSTTACARCRATRRTRATAAAGTETWFDDNGWWGLAFVNAYRATGAKRWLTDAAARARTTSRRPAGTRARAGSGGTPTHPYKAGAALASDTLLATLLYQQTRSSFALAQARKFLAWAQHERLQRGRRPVRGQQPQPDADRLRRGSADLRAGGALRTDAHGGRLPARRTAAERNSLKRFGYLLDFSPQYDAIYLQWMLALYALHHDRTLYALAADNARNAETRARNSEGLYLLSWNGETLSPNNARPGMLQTHAATTSLFAWLAVYPPPA